MNESNKLSELVKEYKSMHFEASIDHDKFNFFSIVHHSTAIEGSTLNELDTTHLLSDGIVSPRSSFHDHLMVKDHYEALLYTIEQGKKKTPISVEVLQNISSLVMKNTGRVINTYGGGSFDESKGDLRTIRVTAGGGSSYLKPENVADAIGALCKAVNAIMKKKLSTSQQLILSFDSHFNFETIHPFSDGNGRTGRLLMNYIQVYYDLPLAIIRKETKKAYIQALIDSRNEKNDLSPIRNFMVKEYSAQHRTEIDQFKESEKKSPDQLFKAIQMMNTT